MRRGPVITENRTKPPPACICRGAGGLCLLVISIPIAPHFHPMSSCLWQRLGVLSRWWSSGIICHCRHPHPHCTLFPPHKQLLMAAVGGAVLVVVLRPHLSSLSSSSSSSSSSLSCVIIVMCHHCCCVSPFPPLPPLSTLVPLVFSSALIYPHHLASPSSPLIRHFNPLIVSPPRLSFQPLPHPLLIPQLSSITVGPIPPVIHPMSSGW